MQPALIVVLCVAAAVVYGVVHDQVTARVCVEYFTVGHENKFDTDDPTLLGLGWGIVATWWVGLILGLGLAVAARVGPRPTRSARSLVRPVLFLLAVMAVFATAAGICGYVAGKSGAVALGKPITERLPREKWAAFQAVALAHLASYWTGFVGGGMQIAIVWASRKRMRPAPPARAPVSS